MNYRKKIYILKFTTGKAKHRTGYFDGLTMISSAKIDIKIESATCCCKKVAIRAKFWIIVML